MERTGPQNGNKFELEEKKEGLDGCRSGANGKVMQDEVGQEHRT